MMRRSPNSSGNLAVNRVWRAPPWEAIQQGQELSFAKTEWCLPATSRKLPAVRSVGKVETDSRPLPPKHQVKPWPCSDQKARKTTNMTWFTKSAKPPSPVQIRAAPPFSPRNSRDWDVCLRPRAISYCSEKPSNCSSLRRATSVNHCIATSCQRAIFAGEEVPRTSTPEQGASIPVYGRASDVGSWSVLLGEARGRRRGSDDVPFGPLNRRVAGILCPAGRAERFRSRFH